MNELPILFFTLVDNDHPQAKLVLNEQLRLLPELRKSFPDSSAAHCATFSKPEDIQEYFRGLRIDPRRAVALFVTTYPCGRKFFPLQRGEKKRGVSVPEWSPAHWAIAVSTTLSEKRIRSAAHQINADFLKHPIPALEEKILPYGIPPQPRSGKKRRQDRRKERRQREFLEFAPAW